MELINPLSKIVLTGGSGFIGYHLLKNQAFREALAIGRSQPRNHQHFHKVSFDEDYSLSEAFNDKEVVVHLAARAHVMNDTAKSPLDEFRYVNTLGTLNLAKQAAIAGVKRFIFVSTIKVLGEQTQPGRAFKSGDRFNPQDAYSISKMEAEVGLKMIGKAHGMEIVIIRPPLVYGQGVKGNFASLLKLTKLPIPLPFGSIQNKRSLVSVENLVDLIVVCLTHPNAKNETFLVSDDDDMDTSDLFSRLAETGGYKAYIFGFPLAMLYISLRLLGKLSIYDRLCGSMQVNIEYTKSQLSWNPPFKVNDSLSNCWVSDTHR
ncbi:NAD-dependent epimerase/dehydratase family protein [Pseudomonadales bacterium]|nr:NAD-dependent epimerase/dehydratase family protein [Pseudomonadales bacterium]